MERFCSLHNPCSFWRTILVLIIQQYYSFYSLFLLPHFEKSCVRLHIRCSNSKTIARFIDQANLPLLSLLTGQRAMRRVILVCLVLVVTQMCALGERSSRIKHIVVLMMENRSFDHLLGWLKQDKNAAIDGLTGKEELPRDINDLSKGTVPVTRLGYDTSPDDPKHLFDDIAVQLNNNKMDGFVYESISTSLNETNPVSMFDINSAPIINTLATEFAVFDRWFCSIPTSTDPNRAFAMSGTSQGVITNFNGTLWTQQSYFDYLRQHDRTFAGYYQDDLWALGYFADMKTDEVASHIFDLETHFFADAAAGNLADFTWLQPRSGTHGADKLPTWQHPDAVISLGEDLIKQVYEALRNGPKWEETLFLITYDEHGGFYDHVVPPAAPAPDSNVAPNGFAFDQLGVRLPTIAISPWIKKGTLVHDALPGEQPTPTSAFDATSTLATTNLLLGLKDAEPLGARMAWANTFAGLVTHLDKPRLDCPKTLPKANIPADFDAERAYRVQRAKPLNEHLVGQLIFFCTMNYLEEHKQGSCPGRPEVMNNQGLASDWIMQEMKKYTNKVPLGTAKKH